MTPAPMIGSAPSAGTGMLAVLCDLEPRWHREFREWLRDDMMPARMRIGGFPAAASYDRIEGAAENQGGTEPFATVYEAASIGDLYGAPYQALRANRDQRDKDFHARFIAPARYTLSWVGPEFLRLPARQGEGSSTGFAPIAVIDRLDIPEAALQAFNMWLVIDYLPRLGAVAGLVRARRYLAMEGRPRHVLLHEFESADALADPAWKAARADLVAHVPTGPTSGAYARVLSVTS